MTNNDKSSRLMQMHEHLARGERIFKNAIIEEFNIPPKTFQRDIDSLRAYYAEHSGGELVYDRRDNCYRLEIEADKLTKKEIFALCKILIESRAFNNSEFNSITRKLTLLCDAADRKTIKNLIANEQINYLPLQHNNPLIDILWELAGYVNNQQLIAITYTRLDGTERTHEIKPVGIMFSEFYFYLVGFMADDSKQFPTVFRVDRIIVIKRHNKRFNTPYKEKFSEAEFRKRVQFMYGGELRAVRFLYRGNLEAVLDRLPTAQIERELDDAVIIRAEAYGSGIDMWLGSQGDKVEML